MSHIISNYYYFNIKTCGNTSFASIVTKIIASQSHVTIRIQWSQRMNLYLLILFSIQYPLSFVTNVSCNLSKETNEILVANVACNYILIVETSQKYLFFFYCKVTLATMVFVIIFAPKLLHKHIPCQLFQHDGFMSHAFISTPTSLVELFDWNQNIVQIPKIL